MTENDRLYSPRDVAELLGVSYERVRQLMLKRQLGKHLGGTRFYVLTQADVQVLLDRPKRRRP